jgi:effector-binding domain-containing protein
MLDTPRIVETDVQQAAVIHLIVPRAEIRSVMGPRLQELMSAVADQGITPTGPWFTHHLRRPGDTFDFEIGVPVSTSVTPTGRVKPGRLPAATVARAIYHGSYEGLGGAWGELGKWLAANGHRPAEDFWEVYAAGPESNPDPASWRTELNRPLVSQR